MPPLITLEDLKQRVQKGPYARPRSMDFNGLKVMVENPAGSLRTGKDANGKPWATMMKLPYGYISRKLGADGEGLDCYVGPNQNAEDVHVIHQNDPDDGRFDEDKIMLGMDSPEQAKAAYLSHYNNPKFYRSMTIIPFADFKDRLTGSAPGAVRWKRQNRRDHGTGAIFTADDGPQFRMSPDEKAGMWRGGRSTGKGTEHDAADLGLGDDADDKVSQWTKMGKSWDEEKPDKGPTDRWITVGGHEGADGKKHGGAPVHVASDGIIDKGPAALKHKTIEEVKEQDRAKTDKEDRAASADPKDKSHPFYDQHIGKPARGDAEITMKGRHALNDTGAEIPTTKDGKKLPHQLTAEEHVKKGGNPAEHEQAVAQALNRGDDVPEKVQDQYPHLAGPAMVEEQRRQQRAASEAAKDKEKQAAMKPPVPPMAVPTRAQAAEATQADRPEAAGAEAQGQPDQPGAVAASGPAAPGAPQAAAPDQPGAQPAPKPPTKLEQAWSEFQQANEAGDIPRAEAAQKQITAEMQAEIQRRAQQRQAAQARPAPAQQAAPAPQGPQPVDPNAPKAKALAADYTARLQAGFQSRDISVAYGKRDGMTNGYYVAIPKGFAGKVPPSWSEVGSDGNNRRFVNRQIDDMERKIAGPQPQDTGLDAPVAMTPPLQEQGEPIPTPPPLPPAPAPAAPAVAQPSTDDALAQAVPPPAKQQGEPIPAPPQQEPPPAQRATQQPGQPSVPAQQDGPAQSKGHLGFYKGDDGRMRELRQGSKGGLLSSDVESEVDPATGVRGQSAIESSTAAARDKAKSLLGKDVLRPDVKRPPKSSLPRAEIERQLLNAYEDERRDVSTADDEVFQRHYNPFTFLRTDKTKSGFPGEVEDFLQRPDAIKFRKAFELTDDPTKSGGEDTAGEFGGFDKYFDAVERRMGSPLQAALASAKASQDPKLNMLAALHETVPARRDAGATEQGVTAEHLQPGEEMTIHGVPVAVSENEDGEKILSNHGALPTVPAEALGSLPLPIDKGTRRESETPEIGDDPFAGLDKKEKPTDAAAPADLPTVDATASPTAAAEPAPAGIAPAPTGAEPEPATGSSAPLAPIQTSRQLGMFGPQAGQEIGNLTGSQNALFQPPAAPAGPVLPQDAADRKIAAQYDPAATAPMFPPDAAEAATVPQMGLEPPPPTDSPIDRSPPPLEKPPASPVKPSLGHLSPGSRLARIKELREQGMTFDQAKEHYGREAEAGVPLAPEPHTVGVDTHLANDPMVQGARKHYEQTRAKTKKNVGGEQARPLSDAVNRLSAETDRSKKAHRAAVEEAIARGDIEGHQSYPDLTKPQAGKSANDESPSGPGTGPIGTGDSGTTAEAQPNGTAGTSGDSREPLGRGPAGADVAGRTDPADESPEPSAATDLPASHPDNVGAATEAIARPADAAPAPATQEQPAADDQPQPASQPETYFKGDRARYTGKVGHDGLHEVELLDGHAKGENRWVATAPDGSNPNPARQQQEWRESQEGFRRLNQAAAPAHGIPMGVRELDGYQATGKMLQSSERPIPGTATVHSTGKGGFEILAKVRNDDGSTAERTLGIYENADAAVDAKRRANYPQDYPSAQAPSAPAAPAAAPSPAPASPPAQPGLINIKEGFHAKKGVPTYVATMGKKVDRPEYNRILAEAKKLGGYYSAFRGAGAVPGFQFPTRDAADQFQRLINGEQPTEGTPDAVDPRTPTEAATDQPEAPPAAASPSATPGGKEPWQMLQSEWTDGRIKSAGMHREHVRQAMAAGKPVPEDVLNQYPDLKPGNSPLEQLKKKMSPKQQYAERRGLSEADQIKSALATHRETLDALRQKHNGDEGRALAEHADALSSGSPDDIHDADLLRKHAGSVTSGSAARPAATTSADKPTVKPSDLMDDWRGTLMKTRDAAQKLGVGQDVWTDHKKLIAAVDEALASQAAPISQGAEAGAVEAADPLAGVEPNADRHDAAHRELRDVNKQHAAAVDLGERQKLSEQRSALQDEIDHHKPAAIARAQAEIDAEKAKIAPTPIDGLKDKMAENELRGAQQREATQEKLGTAADPDRVMTGHESTAANKLADSIAAHLADPNTTSMQFRHLYEHAKRAGMGSLAEGTTTSKDLYDAMELGVNRHILNDKSIDPTAPLDSAIQQADQLDKMLGKLPTQTWRTDEMNKLQQFSTPPHYAFAANWVANLNKGDTVLEPSAGNGGLAVYGMKTGANVVANELSPRRREMLESLGVDTVHGENAEQISKILHDKVKPSVVVMNPPFSQTAGRMGDKKVLQTGANHIDEAMKLLPENGRLVAIVGRGMTPDSPTFRNWFNKLQGQYNLRANVGVDGDVYKKYGTHFGTRMLVIDKNAPTGEPAVTDDASSIPDLMTKLEGVRNDRPVASVHPASDIAGSAQAAVGTPAGDAGADAGPAAGNAGSEPDTAGDRVPRQAAGGGAGNEARHPVSAPARDVGERGAAASRQRGVSDGPTAGRSAGDAAPAGSGGAKLLPERGTTGGRSTIPRLAPAAESRGVGTRRSGDGGDVAPRGDSPIEPKSDRKPRSANTSADAAPEQPVHPDKPKELSNAIYDNYRPQHKLVDIAQPHPTKLVESAAMGAVLPPKPKYRPALPEHLLMKNGEEDATLSEAQLEPITYAGEAHQEFLQSRNKAGEPIRRGFFVGDGCVAAGTRIFNPLTGDHAPIEDLVGTQHTVLSLTQNGFEPRRAAVTFAKGEADLYRVTLDDGRAITVTPQHRFLTQSGWRQLGDGIYAGDLIASAEGGHAVPAMPSSIQSSGGQHCSRTPEDWKDDCCAGLHHDDERLRSATSSDRVTSPSPADVLGRIQPSSHLGDPGTSPECTPASRGAFRRSRSSSGEAESRAHALISGACREACAQLSEARLASALRSETATDFLRLSVAEEAADPLEHACGLSRSLAVDEYRVSEVDTELPEASFRTFLQGRMREHRRGRQESSAQSAPPELRHAASACLYSSGWHRIAAIEFVRRDVFYDMYVPGPENYVAEGIVNHNTGVGKGRIASGILLDGMNQGQKKAVWISKNFKLLEDAQRDWTKLGGSANELLDHRKTKLDGKIEKESGILFTGYGTLKTKSKKEGNTSNRVDQIASWLGKDFDGHIIFDEAHMMKGAMPVKGKRGASKATETALAGMRLQDLLPKAKITYLSATGATEVSNLGYASRLGLWGPGTQFADGADFANEISAGGISGMELVAQSMKQDGSYLARQLSYDGVHQERLGHALTTDQRETYDKLCEGWQSVYANMEKALELTASMTNKNGETKIDGKARGNARGAFESANQRFFNQVLTSMQMPSVIADIEKQLADGHSAVIQLVNTNEASTERELAKRAKAKEDSGDESDDLEDLDITPRDQLLNLVQHSFPVTQHEEYQDESGNTGMRPVLDSKGNPVLNPQAVAMRDRLLGELASVKVPEGPLESLLNHFGHDAVAEVTGRDRRIVRDKATGRNVEQKRGENVALADGKAFQDGRKRILVFSGAGGTGASYHSDKKAQNQQKRVHYLAQAGWVADAAVQGFGRTHRSGEVNQPLYKLVHTDVNAQKRFISTIARRLDQLGALTRGQRQASTAEGMFKETDNLESQYAADALKKLVTDIHANKVPGISMAEFEKQTRLNLMKQDKSGMKLETPPIPQFLNRLLSMKIDTQNKVFDEFMHRFETTLEAAKASGTLDTGMETVKADGGIQKQSESTVYTDPKTGAETKYVKLQLKHSIKPRTFESIASRPNVKFHKNIRSGRVYAMEHSTGINRTDAKTGRIDEMHRRHGPLGKTDYVPSREVQFGNSWAEIGHGEAKQAWDDQIAKAPTHETEDLHMLTGSLLPIWKKVGGQPQVRRLQTDSGEKMLGRVIPHDELAKTLANLGVNAAGGASAPRLQPHEAFTRINHEGDRLRLTGGWTVKPTTVAGERRIELLGPDHRDWARLEQAGAKVELDGFKRRIFIPMSQQGPEVLGRILDQRPVEQVVPSGQNFSADESIVSGRMTLESLKAQLQRPKMRAVDLSARLAASR